MINSAIHRISRYKKREESWLFKFWTSSKTVTTKFSLPIISILLEAASALPAKPLSFKRADSCGQYDTLDAGSFKLYNNLWGEDNGSGSGCIGVDSSGSPLSWHATWSWSGGENQVKSYQNVLPANFSGVQLSSVSSIPSTWDWR